MVGAPRDPINVFDEFQGVAYIFTRSGSVWTQRAKLTPTNATAENYFGSSVAVNNDTVVIGAPGDQAGQGSAYVFSYAGNWVQRQKLTASDGAESDNFGGAVAVSGDTVVVGAPFDDIVGNNDQGSAYVFVILPCPTLTFAPDNLPDSFSGVWYQQQLAVSGGAGSYQFSVSGGALPPGLGLTQSGLLSGWPTMPGAYHFTISATDLGSLCSASRAYTINIIPCYSITLEPESLPDGAKGVYYRETLTATGGKEPYTFSAQGGLPGREL